MSEGPEEPKPEDPQASASMGRVRWCAVITLAGCAVEAPAVKPPWRDGPDLPDGARRLEPGVASLGARLAVVGGFSTAAREGLMLTRAALLLDTFTDTWAALPDAPLELSHINLAGVGGSLFLLGGLETAQFTASGAAFELPIDGTDWVPIAAVPAGLERGAAGVVVSPPHIFLLGGAGSTAAVASCLDYNVTTGMWTRLPDLPAPRSHPAAMRLGDGTLIVAGGLGTLDASQPLADVLALPLGAPAWEAGRHPMLTARGGCAYGKALGQLICAGGEAGRDALTAVEGYDALSDLWVPYPDMPVKRAGTQGIVIGQKLYVPGGAELLAFEPTSTVLVFSPLDAMAPPI